jgi:hypothetical protein
MNMIVSTAALTAGSKATASIQPDDSVLLELEEKIFEQHAAAREYDDEIKRLGAIVQSEGRRLYDEALAAEVRQERYITPQERWERVLTMPECEEEERLSNLSVCASLKDGKFDSDDVGNPRPHAGRSAR